MCGRPHARDGSASPREGQSNNATRCGHIQARRPSEEPLIGLAERRHERLSGHTLECEGFVPRSVAAGDNDRGLGDAHSARHNRASRGIGFAALCDGTHLHLQLTTAPTSHLVTGGSRHYVNRKVHRGRVLVDLLDVDVVFALPERLEAWQREVGWLDQLDVFRQFRRVQLPERDSLHES